MKNKYLFSLVIGVIIFSWLPTHANASTILSDDFNAYANGSIVGQGGWTSYTGGSNFTVQGISDGKALHNTASEDSVIFNTGTALSDGSQSVYIRSENRSSWATYGNGNAQVGLSKGSWGGREVRNFVNVSFKSDGNVAYYDPVSDSYKNFATYNDNEWTLLEFEWRSSDKKAHYRVNGGAWTDWYPIAGSGSFTNLDTVGFDFVAGGSGGVWIDNVGIASVPPPIAVLCSTNSWQCGDWSTCTTGGSQTRTCNKVATCDGGVAAPPTSQSCTYTPPTCNSWTYSSWSDCQTNGTKTRTVISSSPDGCTAGNPVLSQGCSYTPTCTTEDYARYPEN